MIKDIVTKYHMTYYDYLPPLKELDENHAAGMELVSIVKTQTGSYAAYFKYNQVFYEECMVTPAVETNKNE
jgi:hypothetical protein